MLYLDRREGEAIVITLPAGTVTLTFLGYRHCQAYLGVEAPQSVVVDREEIHQRKQRGKEGR